jgi:tetratricopeptide (TPR) repeat protein
MFGRVYRGAVARFPIRVAILSATLAVAAMGASAQATAPEAPAAQQNPQPGAAKPATGEAFPFPDATPKKADGKDFPFPDNAAQPSIPPPAAKEEAPPASPPPPNFSSSVTLHDEGSEGAVHPVEPARASEDASVAKLYWNLGNYEGAYMRYRDAVLYAPQDAAMWFGLAEAERGLGRFTKARADYEKVMQLAPQSKEAREAEKNLRKLPAKDKPQPQGPGPKLP